MRVAILPILAITIGVTANLVAAYLISQGNLQDLFIIVVLSFVGLFIIFVLLEVVRLISKYFLESGSDLKKLWRIKRFNIEDEPAEKPKDEVSLTVEQYPGTSGSRDEIGQTKEISGLVALIFNIDYGAEKMVDKLKQWENEQIVTLTDAAIVTWPAGKKRPKTRQLHDLSGSSALDGAFWGLLFGLIFFVPVFGAAIGAALGTRTLTSSLDDVGIDDDFIKKVQSEIAEGTSALFLMIRKASSERLTEEFTKAGARIITSSLRQEGETKLQATFGSEQ
jgi:uncharacterized membrane protein